VFLVLTCLVFWVVSISRKVPYYESERKLLVPSHIWYVHNRYYESPYYHV
jgi:hypothetical protein